MEPDPTAEPTPSSSKAVVDPLNTVAWFTMDALWLAKLTWPAYAAAAVTVVTGVWLVLLGRREGRGAVYADLGLNCWIVMNTVWLAHDLNGHDTPPLFALAMVVLGGVCMVGAARNKRTVHRFRVARR